MKFPMTSLFPFSFSFQPAVNTKPQRCFRPHMRTPKKAIVTKNFFLHLAHEETQAEIEKELAALH
ncbi:hypothetical protein FF38_00945 [Lucilia cuprina]|uniref:Uncharacterized protein n=1 Tax=Lucilia cuprina TaxID=7375 RepID=A0A0L0BPD2_LUCCU|nr:hypothetical protein FF38_00945 [Lucilia cuprina]